MLSVFLPAGDINDEHVDDDDDDHDGNNLLPRHVKCVIVTKRFAAIGILEGSRENKKTRLKKKKKSEE